MSGLLFLALRYINLYTCDESTGFKGGHFCYSWRFADIKRMAPLCSAFPKHGYNKFFIKTDKTQNHRVSVILCQIVTDRTAIMRKNSSCAYAYRLLFDLHAKPCGNYHFEPAAFSRAFCAAMRIALLDIVADETSSTAVLFLSCISASRRSAGFPMPLSC